MRNPEHLQPSNPNQRVILVAEDEVLIGNIVRIVLESEGYFVLTSQNGEEALDLSRKYPGVIHALLTDVKMPVMDGLKLRKLILAERPGIKVLLMSGHLENTAENLVILHKPFGPYALKQSIRQLLESAAPAQGD